MDLFKITKSPCLVYRNIRLIEHLIKVGLYNVPKFGEMSIASFPVKEYTAELLL